MREGRNVVPSLPQRGDVDGEDVGTIVEVLFEGAFLDLDTEVLVRRGDDPEVRAVLFCAAQPLEGAFLQDPEEFHLDARGKVADLIEEYRAAVGQLKPSSLALIGAGKGALLVTEKLADNGVLGQGSKVDGNKGTVRPCAQIVDRLGNKLFPTPVSPRTSTELSGRRPGESGPGRPWSPAISR